MHPAVFVEPAILWPPPGPVPRAAEPPPPVQLGDAAGYFRSLRATGFFLVGVFTVPRRGGFAGDAQADWRRQCQRVLPFDDWFAEDPGLAPAGILAILIQAAGKWRLELEHSFLLSNHAGHVRAAGVAGCTGLFVDNRPPGSPGAGRLSDGLEVAVRAIRERSGAVTPW